MIYQQLLHGANQESIFQNMFEWRRHALRYRFALTETMQQGHYPLNQARELALKRSAFDSAWAYRPS